MNISDSFVDKIRSFTQTTPSSVSPSEKQVNEIAKLIHTTSNVRPSNQSSEFLAERILALEQITPEKLSFKRNWQIKLCTLAFINLYDHVRIKNILNDRQLLIEKYLQQILSPSNTDPEKNTHLLQILEHADTKTSREILKYALKAENSELIKRCRESLGNDSFKQKELQKLFVPSRTFVDTYDLHDTAALRYLIAEGVNVNTKVHGKTLLQWSIGKGETNRKNDIVDLLIKAGVSLEPQEPGERSPLMHALAADNKRAALKLIAAGANVHPDPNEPSINVGKLAYKTPLDYASAHGGVDIVAALLAKGARANEGHLKLARESGFNSEIVKQLVAMIEANLLKASTTPQYPPPPYESSTPQYTPFPRPEPSAPPPPPDESTP